jgi:YesN/AraC family two-component response regulator
MLKTLIVEDSTQFKQILKDILLARFPSMEVIEARDGEEALEKIDSSCPDIIFMDIKLPGKNGLELTKKIKADCPEMVIVILTSYDLPEYREVASRYGANYFLSKGTATKEQILTLLESIISKK